MERSIRKIYKVYNEAHTFIAKKSNQIENKQIQDLISNIYAPGPSYHFVFDFSRFEFDFITESIREIIGEEPHTFTAQKFFEHIHPDDRDYYKSCEETVFKFLYSRIDRSDIPYYKVSYQFRVRRRSGYKLFLHQSIAIELDEQGNLMKTFVSASDISHITTVNNKGISFIGLEGRPSYFNITCLEDLENYQSVPVCYSDRETEVLRLISEGYSAGKIATFLSIAESTVRTHRKNILSKSDCKNTVEAVASAIRGGLI